MRDFKEIGRQAFLKGEASAPTLNKEVQAAISNLSVGQGAAKIMRAFSEGWHEANLEAQVEATAYAELWA